VSQECDKVSPLFLEIGLNLMERAMIGRVVAVVVWGLWAVSAFAYEEVVVRGGGSIRGVTVLRGELPPARAFTLEGSPFAEFCAKISDGKGRVVLDEYVVGENGAFQDVVVAVRNVKAGKPFPHITAKLTATDCMFHPAEVSHEEMHERDMGGRTRHIHPLVTVFENHRPISIINEDPIIHNGQVFQKENGHIVLNFPLPAVAFKSQGGVMHFGRGAMVGQILCGIHAFMQTFGLVVDNPYYAKTKRNGQFFIPDLPPGTYEVLAWHPHFKPQVSRVTVMANQETMFNVTFDSSEVKRRVFESEGGLKKLL
jgi:hypothetical protein